MNDLFAYEADASDRSLRHYVYLAWPIVEPTREYVSSWHVDAMCDHLSALFFGEIKTLLINVPPGCMKSLTTSVFFPTWAWRKRPDTRWMFSSYDSELSTRDSMKRRLIYENGWYRSVSPKVRLRSGSDQKTFYESTEGGYQMATSVGGHTTGEHPDFQVVDDAHNVKRATSETERAVVLNWHDQAWSTRGVARDVRRVYVMQRVHEGDLSGHLLRRSRELGLVHLCLPMEYEPKRMITTPLGFQDPRTDEGELLCPSLLGPAAVSTLKVALGSYGTAGQLQQRPAPAEGGIFKETWWQWYENLKDVEPFDELAMSWDMTFKKTGTSWVVGQVWGRKGARCYLLDQVRGKWGFVETKQQFLMLCVKWPDAVAKFVEDKANGTAVMDELGATVQGIVAVEPEGGKESRAHAVSPIVEAKNVFLPRAAGWVDDFVAEASAFPNGLNDDQVDCMSQLLIRFKHKLVITAAVARPDMGRPGNNTYGDRSGGEHFGRKEARRYQEPTTSKGEDPTLGIPKPTEVAAYNLRDALGRR